MSDTYGSSLKTYKLRLIVEYTAEVEAVDKEHAWDKAVIGLKWTGDACSRRVLVEETEVIE